MWGKAAAGLLTASIAGLLSVLRPAEATVAYRAWNKAARMYERAACTAVLALCYGVVAAAGCAGSSLRLQRPAPERSLWYPKATLSLDAYRSQADRPGRPSTGHPWLEVVAWARRSGNTWRSVRGGCKVSTVEQALACNGRFSARGTAEAKASVAS